MKRVLVLVAFLCVGFNGFSQNPGYTLLKKINGVEIYHKVKKVKEGVTRTNWVIEIEYINATDSDLYFKSSEKLSKSSLNTILDGKDRSRNLVTGYFAVINLENANFFSMVSDFNSTLSGDRLRILTDNAETIHQLKKNKTYTEKLDFRAKKGIDPVITVEIVNSIAFTNNVKDFF